VDVDGDAEGEERGGEVAGLKVGRCEHAEEVSGGEVEELCGWEEEDA
jgi:hypothetical protein